MQTDFTLAQLADPAIAEADAILRTCVHCGFCTATCPTYLLTGDELDSPRGRIYLIKDMLENERSGSGEVAKHIDRCLSCFSCMTTCPASVDYMHLADHARSHIEETYRRPLLDRLLRAFLAEILPYPARFRLATLAGFLARPFAPLFRALPGLKPIAAMIELAPSRLPPLFKRRKAGTFSAGPAPKKRVALMAGCAHPVLRPDLNETTIRLLNRHGIEVILASGEGCCGALPLHMGKSGDGEAMAKRNIDAWIREMDGAGLDAIVINASGCGTTVKDYGHLFQHDPGYQNKAQRVAPLARDITEFLDEISLLPPTNRFDADIAYHSACSMQHGQKIAAAPRDLLKTAGFRVHDIPEGHLCCGSAGTYNMLQPDLSRQLRDRKVGHIQSLSPDAIAAGNLGCMVQIGTGTGTGIPIVHTVELLDWATGGPCPDNLKHLTLTGDRGPSQSKESRNV